jgi:hypothetical protein
LSHEMLLSRGRSPSYWPNATWLAALCELPVTPPGSKSTSRAERSCRKLGGPASGRCVKLGGPHREGEEPKPMMHGRGKSDEAVVAVKPANWTAQAGRESVERRAEAKGNAGQTHTCRTQRRASVTAGTGLYTAKPSALPSFTQGGSRMRESRTYGSVRGALSNGRPYRDPGRTTLVVAARRVRPGRIRQVVSTLVT